LTSIVSGKILFIEISASRKLLLEKLIVEKKERK